MRPATCVENSHEFPNLQLFTWSARGSLLKLEQPGVLVVTGHEDGAGGAEAGWWVDDITWRRLRDYPKDYETILRHYVVVAKQLGLQSISWEPALQREIEQMYFCYSQFGWEPTVSWNELARRFVIYAERRPDERLAGAYRQLLELDHEVHLWGIPSFGPGYDQGVRQVIVRPNIAAGIMEEVPYGAHRDNVRQRVKQFGDSLRDLGLLKENSRNHPRCSTCMGTGPSLPPFASDEVPALRH